MRRTQFSRLSDELELAISEISLVSFFSNNDIVNLVMRSCDPSLKSIANKCLKTAACLSVVQGSHGSFRSR